MVFQYGTVFGLGLLSCCLLVCSYVKIKNRKGKNILVVDCWLMVVPGHTGAYVSLVYSQLGVQLALERY